MVESTGGIFPGGGMSKFLAGGGSPPIPHSRESPVSGRNILTIIRNCVAKQCFLAKIVGYNANLWGGQAKCLRGGGGSLTRGNPEWGSCLLHTMTSIYNACLASSACESKHVIIFFDFQILLLKYLVIIYHNS